LSRINGAIGGGWNRYDGDHFGEVIMGSEQHWPASPPITVFTNNNGVKDDANIYAKANIQGF
jgi:iron complex outermembrane receptor protein